jgi:hypothetical protein
MWQDEYLNDIWRHGSSDREMCWDTVRFLGDKKSPPKESTGKFSVGDSVRLRHGRAMMKIVKTRGHAVQADYVSRTRAGYAGCLKWRPESDFVFYSTPNNDETVIETEERNTDMKNKLYQTREATPRFGTMLAVNSQGKLVLEMKGTGEVLAFDKNEVDVVMPYTFGIRFPNNGTEYHYLGVEGDVEVGDYVILDNSPVGKSEIARVTSVNTRSEAATVAFKGVKLLTKRIGE